MLYNKNKLFFVEVYKLTVLPCLQPLLFEFLRAFCIFFLLRFDRFPL